MKLQVRILHRTPLNYLKTTISTYKNILRTFNLFSYIVNVFTLIFKGEILTRTIQSLDHINLEWLNETLQRVEEFQNNSAIDLKVKRVGEGIGQLGEFALLELKLKNGDDLNLFLKIQTDTEDMDTLAKDYQFYLREVKFYNNLSSQINVKTPKPYYVEHDEVSGRVLLLLEYMDGWYSPDQIEGASLKEIELAIEGLIPISSQFWGTVKDIEWIPDMKESYMLKIVDDMVEYQPEFLNRFGHLMNDSRKKLLKKIVDYYPNFPQILSDGILTLTHWDYRVENLFFTPNVDDITVIDWQLMMANKPGWDLAYLLCTNVQIDIRREIFEESCEDYLQGLKNNGIDFTKEELNKNMMISLLAMMTFPVVGGANYDLENMRSKRLFEVFTERLFSAVEDYDAISYIE